MFVYASQVPDSHPARGLTNPLRSTDTSELKTAQKIINSNFTLIKLGTNKRKDFTLQTHPIHKA